MTDPITDMLNRIRNAQAVDHPTVDVPFSKFKYEIAKVLEKNGFISKVDKKSKKAKDVMEITLKYKDKIGVISGLRKVSKPGQRIYSDYFKLKRVRSGYGLSVISTSKGLMTDREAKRTKTGGEVIFEIW
ncbi:MAG: 30S ribosomal protein S8 [Candidatus Nealsonbacteria bacterium]